MSAPPSGKRSSRSTATSSNLALQVALLVPILASGLGLFNSFRMLRLPDVEPSGGIEGAVLG